jgi:hypothetical protein
MKKVLFTLMALLLASAVRSEVPVSAAGVYRSWSGIETRRITLLTNGNYLARWDGDIGSNGASSGTWELVGTEVRLSPKKEEGMISGHFRVLLLRDFKGRQALLRKEDEEHAENEFFHLFLQTQEPNKSPQTTRASGPRV